MANSPGFVGPQFADAACLERDDEMGLPSRLAMVVASIMLGVVACQDAAPVPQSSDGQQLQYEGQAHVIASDFLGVNGEAISTDLAGRIWRDPEFATTMARLRPGNIRLFGGTSANLWDWRSGRLGKSGPTGTAGYIVGRPNLSIEIPQFANVANAAGATGVAVLNMTSSTLRAQLAALSALESAGVRVRRVELGNELWAPGYKTSFRDGAAYARAANVWIAAIHNSFPGVKVAVDAVDPASAGDVRAGAWNRELFANLRGADAAVLHSYLRAPSGAPVEVLSAPSRQWTTSLVSTLETIPQHLPVWVTEWNYAPAASGNSAWGHALGNILFALRLLASRRIGLADFHDLVGADGSLFAAVWATSDRHSPGRPLHYRLSPAGVALQLLFGAFAGCSSVQSVYVAGAAGPTGVACLTAGMKHVLIVNPAPTAIIVDTSAVVGHGPLSIASVAESPASVAVPRVERFQDASSVRIPAWSVTVLSA